MQLLLALVILVSSVFAAEPKTRLIFSIDQAFGNGVTATELKNAIHTMPARFPETAAVSDNVTDLRLVHFNLNPEVFAPNGNRGRLGLALRNIRVELVQR